MLETWVQLSSNVEPFFRLSARNLGNEPVFQIVVQSIRSCHTSANAVCHENALQAIPSGGFACISQNTDVLDKVGARSCSVAFSGEEATSGDATVQVKFSTFAATVRFRVWRPEKLRLEATETNLNKISLPGGAAVMNPAKQCKSALYQSATLTASAVLTRVDNTNSNNKIVSRRLDFTRLFNFAVTSGDSKAVTIAKNVVQGVQPTKRGESVTVGCKGGIGPCPSDAVITFVVSDKIASVTELKASVLNTLSVSSTFKSGASFGSMSPFTIRAEAQNVLDSEGDTAQVFATAKTSDGAYIALTKAELNVTSPVLSVTKTITLTVPVGASKMGGRDLVKVAWWSCGVEVVSANPYVLVNLPAVTGITVTLVTHRVIFFTSDPLAGEPVWKPTSTQVKAIVSFANNAKKDFSKDKRVVFSVDRSELAVVYNKHYIRTPRSKSTGKQTPFGDVTITGSLGSYAPGIVGKVVLKVDKFDSLFLSSQAYPICSNAKCARKTTMNRLPNGKGDGRVFQRVRLSLTAKSKLQTVFSVGLGRSVQCSISDRTVINLHNMDGPCPASGSAKECTLSNGELNFLLCYCY